VVLELNANPNTSWIGTLPFEPYLQPSKTLEEPSLLLRSELIASRLSVILPSYSEDEGEKSPLGWWRISIVILKLTFFCVSI
jgi:hypothetical protein